MALESCSQGCGATGRRLSARTYLSCRQYRSQQGVRLTQHRGSELTDRGGGVMRRSWWSYVSRMGLPVRCLLCAATAPGPAALCAACAGDLPRIGPACLRCALPLPVSGTCGSCLRVPPAWDSATAVWSYAGAVPWLVARYKFSGSLVHGRVLAQGLVESLADCVVRPDVIVPVPLHPRRLRVRGFNQALELARPLGKRLGVPVEAVLARRTIFTAEQSGLDAIQRRTNVRGAFHVGADLRGLSVAIVDDVLTTGNTVSELSAELRRVGARFVHIWVCARAAPPR